MVASSKVCCWGGLFDVFVLKSQNNFSANTTDFLPEVGRAKVERMEHMLSGDFRWVRTLIHYPTVPRCNDCGVNGMWIWYYTEAFPLLTPLTSYLTLCQTVPTRSP